MTVAKKRPPTRKAAATKKPVARTRPTPARPEPAKPSMLYPGDKLEMGISVAVRIGGMESWVKVGGETTIREDEDFKEAGVRLRKVVERYLDGSVKSLEEALS